MRSHAAETPTQFFTRATYAHVESHISPAAVANGWPIALDDDFFEGGRAGKIA